MEEDKMNAKTKILKSTGIILSIVFLFFAIMLMYQLDIACFIAGICCWTACIMTAKIVFN
jgi:hypothetical protein